MPEPDYILIPLRRLDGTVAAVALIDAEDAALATWRWHLHVGGYAARKTLVEGRRHRTVYLHRAVLDLTFGDARQGDHVDGNRLDCRRANLRIVERHQNSHNRASREGSTSKHRGVSWDKRRNRWRAVGTARGRYVHIGYFAGEAAAASAASAWRLRNFSHTNEDRAMAAKAVA